MRLLLDTHVAKWSVAYSHRIGNAARAFIADSADEVFVSSISIFEIAIKWSPRDRINRLPFGPADARRHLAKLNYTTLPVTDAHAEAVATLPQLHGDPFDRLLVAQALTEPLRLVSADEKVLAYGASFVDARA